jgi:endonuclease YncB( thermonuclease family)
MAHDFNRFPELTNSQAAIYYWDSPHKQIFEDFAARVVKVTDGDSIRVETDFRDFDFPVRLAYINAPEMNEGGAESKSWLEGKIMDEEVLIKMNPDNRVGKFGRIIGDVIFDGQSISSASLQEMQARLFQEAIL